MKTPKEKAKELVEQYYEILPQQVNIKDAKKCALIAIDEHMYPNPIDGSYMDEKYYEYWIDVKHEIINI